MQNKNILSSFEVKNVQILFTYLYLVEFKIINKNSNLLMFFESFLNVIVYKYFMCIFKGGDMCHGV